MKKLLFSIQLILILSTTLYSQDCQNYPTNVSISEDFMKAFAYEMQKDISNYTEVDALSPYGIFGGTNDYNYFFHQKQTMDESQSKRYIQQELSLKPQILAIYSYGVCSLLESGNTDETNEMVLNSMNKIFLGALGIQAPSDNSSSEKPFKVTPKSNFCIFRQDNTINEQTVTFMITSLINGSNELRIDVSGNNNPNVTYIGNTEFRLNNRERKQIEFRVNRNVNSTDFQIYKIRIVNVANNQFDQNVQIIIYPDESFISPNPFMAGNKFYLNANLVTITSPGGIVQQQISRSKVEGTNVGDNEAVNAYGPSIQNDLYTSSQTEQKTSNYSTFTQEFNISSNVDLVVPTRNSNGDVKSARIELQPKLKSVLYLPWTRENQSWRLSIHIQANDPFVGTSSPNLALVNPDYNMNCVLNPNSDEVTYDSIITLSNLRGGKYDLEFAMGQGRYEALSNNSWDVNAIVPPVHKTERIKINVYAIREDN